MYQYDIYKTILQNDSIKKEFQDYVRIIVNTIAEESYPYMYIIICFIVLNFVLIVTILMLIIFKL